MKKLLSLFLIALLLLGSIPALALAQGDQDTAVSGNYVEGEAIVCIKADTGMLRSYSVGSDLLENAEVLMDLESSTEDISTFSAGSSGDTLALVHSDSQSTTELITALEALPQVEFAEPNYIYTTSEDSSTATGDLTGYQWAYQTQESASYDLSVPDWNTYNTAGTPTPSVDTSGTVVAVLDSGIDYNHEDLNGVMWTASEELQKAIGGGKYGYNAVTQNSKGEPYDSTDPMDDNSHGTHCAGIIAAQWDKTGVSGATSGAQLMAVKAGNDVGQLFSADILKGFAYIKSAAQNGVPITAINNSWGGGAEGQALDRGVRALGEAGIVSVFSSGNEAKDCDRYADTASTFWDNPYVVVVNATDANGELASFSNYGASTTDVAAPGVNILSTIPSSMAAFVNASFIEGVEDEATPQLKFTSEAETTTREISLDMAIEGSKSLKVTATEKRDRPRGLITSEPIDLLETPYTNISYNYRADSTETQALDGQQSVLWVKTTVKDEEGNPVWKQMAGHADYCGWWGSVSGTLPKDTDYKSFQIKIAVARVLSDGTTLGTGDSYIDNITMGDTVLAYGYKSGTSMAAPAVTGEVAILAKAFVEDSAAKTAARVIGSVKPLASQSGKSISEGLAQVDKALKEETVPVVNTAVLVGDNQLAISGYFFGDNPTVKIDDEEVTVDTAATPTTAGTAPSDEEQIVVTLPEGMEAGVKRIEVTSTQGSGHNFFELGAVSSLYTRLPLPIEDAQSFYDSKIGSLTGLGGSLYYCGQTSQMGLEFWRYTPGQAENNGWTRLNGQDTICPTVNSACTWDGKLVTMSDGLEAEDSKIAVYNPDTETWSTFTSDLLEGLGSTAFVNTGSELLLIGGAIVENNELVPQKSIYRVDVAAQSVEKIGELQSARISPAVAYTEDGSVYVAAGSDGENIVDGLEKIENGRSTLIRESVLPEGLDSQSYTGSFGTLDGGMLLSGLMITGDNGQVTQDTYFLGFDGEEGFTPTGKIMSTSKLLNSAGMAYQGTYYTLALTEYAENNQVFSADNTVKTLAQPGDKAMAPVNPENGENQTVSTNAGTGLTAGASMVVPAIVGVLVLVAIILALVYFKKRK